MLLKSCKHLCRFSNCKKSLSFKVCNERGGREWRGDQDKQMIQCYKKRIVIDSGILILETEN